MDSPHGKYGFMHGFSSLWPSRAYLSISWLSKAGFSAVIIGSDLDCGVSGIQLLSLCAAAISSRYRSTVANS